MLAYYTRHPFLPVDFLNISLFLINRELNIYIENILICTWSNRPRYTLYSIQCILYKKKMISLKIFFTILRLYLLSGLFRVYVHPIRGDSMRSNVSFFFKLLTRQTTQKKHLYLWNVKHVVLFSNLILGFLPALTAQQMKKKVIWRMY